jgi:F0F1-type ATP synthase gamma subunit
VIADALMEKFISGDYDKIELIYNQFKNAATQIVQTEQFYHWQYTIRFDNWLEIIFLNRPKKRLS